MGFIDRLEVECFRLSKEFNIGGCCLSCENAP